ncbi:MAG: cytochrome o ubiquinol oxidase subunit IV [Pseudomonadota bacterium]
MSQLKTPVVDEHDPHHQAGGAAHGTFREYLVGLGLSLLLTAIAFGAVAFDLFPEGLTMAVILVTAVGQLLVQLIYFLHMNGSSGQLWNTVSAVFVVVLVAILIVGSIWIMQHLNHNMLLGH